MAQDLGVQNENRGSCPSVQMCHIIILLLHTHLIHFVMYALTTVRHALLSQISTSGS
jgi:hypothetical protein